MWRRIVAFVLLVCTLFSETSILVYAKQRNYTVDNVIDMAMEHSEGAQSATIEKIKKEIELKQAKDAIKDIRKNESTIRFSLLFNIKFPESHGMPKEIELVTKVPQIQTEIAILKEQIEYEKLNSSLQSQLAFYDVLQLEYEVKFYEQRLEDSKKLLETTEAKFKTGNGKKEDVDYIKGLVKEYESGLNSAITSLDRKKEKLGDFIGVDVRVGYTFTEYLPEANITRSQLTEIISYAKENDFNLYKATQDRKYAEKEVEEVLSVYRSKYAKYIGDIEAYIKANEGKTMDYDVFIQKYNHALTQIDSPWNGVYVINLLFFKIKIPKEWFKGTYSGTRYMEDEKYALFISLVDRDKARTEEKNVEKALVSSIKDSYETLKQMENAYSSAKESLENTEKSYEVALKENKLGLTTFSTLESMRTGMYEAQRSLYEMQIEYAKALANFDFITSGYVSQLLEGSESVEGDYEAGSTFADEFGEESKNAIGATWYIKTSASDYKFTFGVSVPSEYDVNYYELYYGNMLIGSRMKTSKTLTHLALTYEDSSKLCLKLYKDTKLKYIAYFDGGDYGGELQLQKAENAISPLEEENIAVGQWSFVKADMLRSEFSFAINGEYDYDIYVILYKDVPIAEVEKDKTWKTLNLYLSNVENITIKIKKSGKEVKSFRLEQTEEGMGNVLSIAKE